MASNSHITVCFDDETSFTFCMIFNAWDEMNGVIVLPSADITHPRFIEALSRATQCYPYQEVLSTLEEYGDDILTKSARFDGQDKFVDTLKEGIGLGLVDVPDDLLKMAQDIQNENWRVVQSKPHKKSYRRNGYVYLIRGDTNPTSYKIGYTANVEKRAATFGVKLPFPIEFVCTIKTDDMIGLETELHKRFADKRLDGEWFDLSDEDVEYIRGLA